MILQSERLRLRHFTEDDLDLIVEINNHPECIRFNRWDSMSVEDCKDSLDKWIAMYATTIPGCGVFCVENLSEEKIGMAFLTPLPVNGEFEIGFRLRRCHWEKGYATEISRAFLQYAKAKLHATVLIGIVHNDNSRSRKVFEKLNFSCTPHPDGGDGLIYRFEFT